ncbi:MAG: YerC/YecD family TrpR-related protein [Acutalibacteraceae bacterium]|jgi:TrpR-related protein YerC/YecD|nr:YerC/YecD family TrpR-related protein [Acutalibacteraceae bacterium]
MQRKNKSAHEKLFKAILSLKSNEECSAFFDDICTIQELEALAQRLEVACLLNEGKSYIDINKATGASTATICRVSKCLNYGEGGYATAIERLENNDI